MPPEIAGFFRGIVAAYHEKVGHAPPPDMTVQEVAVAVGVYWPSPDEHTRNAIALMRRVPIEPWKIRAFAQTRVIATADNADIVDEDVLAFCAGAPQAFAEVPPTSRPSIARCRPQPVQDRVSRHVASRWSCRKRCVVVRWCREVALGRRGGRLLGATDDVGDEAVRHEAARRESL